MLIYNRPRVPACWGFFFPKKCVVDYQRNHQLFLHFSGLALYFAIPEKAVRLQFLNHQSHKRLLRRLCSFTPAPSCEHLQRRSTLLMTAIKSKGTIYINNNSLVCICRTRPELTVRRIKHRVRLKSQVLVVCNQK